jgi:Ca-activated chloride channel family protein
MNRLFRLLAHSFASLIFALCITQTAFAAGLLTPANSNLPQLHIKQHHVNVIIENGYAITSIEQTFFNPHDQELEAIYSFPVPEKAAVGEFTYWIDGKPITGEVLEKKQARAIYEQEKSHGRETALVEQNAHRTFENSVYPVRAQQDVKIKLVYIQPAHIDSGVGRYVYPLEEGGTDEETLAFWNYNTAVTEAFSFNLTLRSSYPLDGVRLPNHPSAVVTSTDAQHWHTTLVNNSVSIEENGATNASQVIHHLDKDIVLYWRHQQGLPGTVDMITHKEPGSERGTFMLTITPGDDLAVIREGRDWVFVLDLSGSMQGKYHSMVEGVNRGLHKLKPEDRFRVILFNDGAREITRGYTTASAENVSHYLHQLENTPPSGGTNLYAGLKKGIDGLDADRASAIILVTDGEANVGVTEKKQFLHLLEQKDVRLFTFVMGNSANRPLLDGMAKKSNGFAMSISNSDDIIGQILLATGKLTHEAFHDIEVNIKGIKVKNMTPAHIGSLYHGQQLIIFGHYWGHGMTEVSINGKISGQPKSYQTRFEFPQQSTATPEVERLWAYASIEDLQAQMDYLGEDADTRQAIVGIAMEYGLVTNYTSMIVVREEIFKQLAIDRTNATRIEKEQQARAHRSINPIQDNRQDTQQPAFNTPRAYPSGSGSGGGAISGWTLIFLTPLLLLRRRSLRKSRIS